MEKGHYSAVARTCFFESFESELALDLTWSDKETPFFLEPLAPFFLRPERIAMAN